MQGGSRIGESKWARYQVISVSRSQKGTGKRNQSRASPRLGLHEECLRRERGGDGEDVERGELARSKAGELRREVGGGKVRKSLASSRRQDKVYIPRPKIMGNNYISSPE